LKADLCQIYTMSMASIRGPRIVPGAQKLSEISYDEMLELASLGAKVMPSRARSICQEIRVVFEVPLQHERQPRNDVKEETKSREGVVIRGVASTKPGQGHAGGVPTNPHAAASSRRWPTQR